MMFCEGTQRDVVQEQAPKQRCTFSPTIYNSVALLAPIRSVQFSSGLCPPVHARPAWMMSNWPHG